MDKKFVHLIPAIFLLFSFSCQSARAESPLSGVLNEKKQNTITHEEETLPNIEPTPLPQITKEGYWETSGVDISNIHEGRKLIALTFDDAPARTLENILAVFARFNEENPDCTATATLFVNGGRMDEQSVPLLYAATALGFELGNHTHRHADLTKLEKEELTQEIVRTDELLEKIDGRKLHLLRAPFGRTNALVKENATTPLIDWTIDTLDWTGVTAEDIFDSVWNGRFSGAISLMHDGYEQTVIALKMLLPALKEDGYQVVTVSQMIKAHGCHFEKGKTYIRARKQN